VCSFGLTECFDLGFMASTKKTVIFIILLLVFSCSARADGLAGYLASLGPATAVEVAEKDPLGPTRIVFQSQVWRSVPWRHELIIKNPEVLKRTDFVVMSLTGGHGGVSHHDGARRLADALGVRSVVLTRVPNQPLFGGRTEDELLSFTLNEYRQSGDSSWPLLFPMVASVVKGIDVLQGALGQSEIKVVLIGASKRGWTTYLSAAVERRIVGMVPAVFEMVSMQRQIALARARYGRDSEKIRPYTALGLTDALLEPRVKQLIQWLDPHVYAKNYTIPKLVLLGANDPYWVVDSVREYWGALPEPKMLRILPNVGHGVLSEQQAHEAIVLFVSSLLGNRALPAASWSISSASAGQALISGKSKEPLSKCLLWRAVSATPDFREALFKAGPCEVQANGRRFSARVRTCHERHTAAFVELIGSPDIYENLRGLAPSVSTESHVWLAGSAPQGSQGHRTGVVDDSPSDCR
jgi:PhoPQ-activated pathogenicity-related protein